MVYVIEKIATYMLLVSLICCNLIYTVNAADTKENYQSEIYQKYKNAVEKTNNLNYQEYKIKIDFLNKTFLGNSLFKKIGNSFNYITNLNIQEKLLRMWSDGKNTYTDTPLGIFKSEENLNDLIISNNQENFSNNIINSISMEKLNNEVKFSFETNSKDITCFANTLLKQFNDKNNILGIREITNINDKCLYEVYVNKEGFAYKFITHIILKDNVRITTTVELINIGKEFSLELPKENVNISDDIVKNNDINIDFSEKGVENSFEEIINFINNLGW